MADKLDISPTETPLSPQLFNIAFSKKYSPLLTSKQSLPAFITFKLLNDNLEKSTSTASAKEFSTFNEIPLPSGYKVNTIFTANKFEYFNMIN